MSYILLILIFFKKNILMFFSATCWFFLTFLYLLVHTFVNWDSSFNIKNITKNDILFIILLIYIFIPFIKGMKITLPNGLAIQSKELDEISKNLNNAKLDYKLTNKESLGE